MSKDTPEVGDVWEYKTDDKHKIHIVKEYKCYPLDGVFRSEEDCRRYDCVHRCNTRKEIETGSYLKEELIKYYTYLGKSKANIDDLFKTEESND